MVAKTTHGKSFKGLLHYCLNQKKNAEILDLNGLSRYDAKGLIKEFEAVCGENLNISKPVWHTSLSFSNHDNISIAQMKEIACKLFHKVGFTDENNQYIVIQHKDKDHMHCHIVANRIGFDGKAVTDFYSKSRIVQATKQLEKEYNLTRVQDISKKRLIQLEKNSLENSDKKQIAASIENILEQNNTKTFQDLADKLKMNGIEMQVLKHSKTGKEYGITFKTGNEVFKGSELGKKYAYKRLSMQLHPALKIISKVISKGIELGI
jgi:hypothetical protein